MAVLAVGSEAAVQDAERLAFISHKHRDADLADLVARLLRTLSGGRVDTFVSSSDHYESPGFTGALDESLRKALARSGLVVLVYTDPSEDWEWCLWECGVATDPTDDTRTRVEVFSFAGATPKPYQTKLSVRLAGADGVIEDRGEVSLLTFAKQFCRDPEFWPDAAGAVAPGFKDHEIKGFVDGFMEALEQIGPRGVDRARERLVQIAENLSPDASALLLPAIERAAAALQWGTGAGPQRKLFEQCWQAAYVRDLEKLANRTLVFRPPAVGRFWEMLLHAAAAACPLDRTQPWIRLVSGEDRDDPIEFWYRAMEDPTAHSRAYETAVREVAGELRTQRGRDLVERRFLFTPDYFARGSDRVEHFEEVAEWMERAGIVVSIGRRDDVPEESWLDFALVGELAISRFESVNGVENRVLLETFAPEEVARGEAVWQENLRARWTSSGDEPLRGYLARNGGLI